MPNRCFILFAVIFLFSFFGNAQRSQLRQAEILVEHGKYKQAIGFYDQLIINDNNPEWYLERGICHFTINQLDAARADFNTALNAHVDNPMIWYYLGKLAHAKENFPQAIRYYKNFLRNTSPNHERREEVKGLIKQSGTGKLIKYAPQYAFVENLGNKVNTRFHEFSAIESPTVLGKYYFNSNRSGSFGGLRGADGYKDDIYGQYFVDIYTVESQSGSWKDLKPINEIINGPKHDVLIDFSSDGSYALYYQSRKLDQGKILVDSFNLKENLSLEVKEFVSPVVGELGDVYAYLFNDTTIVFSSKRMGGFGGYDIYVTQKRKGKWIQPVNMGPEVNSPFDEISPALSNDGTVLYFSSNGYRSMGGFDIFKTHFDYTSKSWKEPVNLGPPVNSSEDDCYFRLSADGRTASFSSTRKTGLGGYDLYLAYLKEQETSQLTFTPVLPYLFFNYKETNQRESELVDQTISEAEAVETEPESTREFFIKPLYYGDDDVILHPANMSRLNKVFNIMMLYPRLSLIITSHSTDEELKAYELYFSIKRAEEVAQELIKRGIQKDRLIVKACGANYPVAKFPLEGGSRSVSEKYNRRIDLELIGEDLDEVTLEYERPIIADFLQDRKHALYKTLIDGLSYRVEVAKLNQMFQHDLLQEYSDIMINKDLENNLYRYTVGLYSQYEDALRLKKELIKNDIFQAKVIPYVNDIEIPTTKLVDLSAQFPDLVEYLKHEH